MSWNIEEISAAAQRDIESASDAQALEALRVKYLGRKGIVSQIYDGLSTLSAEEKPRVGKGANELKNRITEFLSEKQKLLQGNNLSGPSAKQTIDVTIPGVEREAGRRHILSSTI